MQKLARAIDRFSDLWGGLVTLMILLMIGFGAYNAVARYVGRYIGLNLSSNTYLELQWYLFSLIFLLGAGWTLKRDAHVRVDVLYAKLSPRGKAKTNLIGTFILLIPFSIFTLWASIPSVRNSWSIREVSPNPGGLPVYPLKSVILVCFVLLILQAISQAIKAFRVLRNPETALDAPEAIDPLDHKGAL